MADPGATIFLLANMALAFYNTGTIWAMEVDIFRSWRLLDKTSFAAVRKAHWKKLPYWIFTPVGLAFAGAIILVWYHPACSPPSAIWINLVSQLSSHLGTAIFWGPWQARLSTDPLAAESPLLQKILRTHWVRTSLITICGGNLFVWVVLVVLRCHLFLQ
jgi:hypothetical protein